MIEAIKSTEPGVWEYQLDGVARYVYLINGARLEAYRSITASGDGCNECQVLLDTPTGIYASFVMTVVAEEDASRAIWPSCPARKQP